MPKGAIQYKRVEVQFEQHVLKFQMTIDTISQYWVNHSSSYLCIPLGLPYAWFGE